MERRKLLVSLGTTGLAGLVGYADVTISEPAGSRRFRNDDDLPHEIGIQVTAVGARPADNPNAVQGEVTVPPAHRELRASVTLEPDTEQSYEETFTKAVWYAVEFTLDDQTPEDGRGITRFHPTPRGRDDGRFLVGRVDPAGQFAWQITKTPDPGGSTGERPTRTIR